MTPYYEDFEALEPASLQGVLTADDTVLTVAAQGRVTMRLATGETWTLENVQWVPELNGRLFSSVSLGDRHLQTVTGRNDERSFIAEEGALDKPLVHLTTVSTPSGGRYYELDCTILNREKFPAIPPRAEALLKRMQAIGEAKSANASETSKARATWRRWHRRLTHISPGMMDSLFKPGVVRGADLEGKKCLLDGCPCCVQSKLCRAPFRVSKSLRKRKLGLIHMDIIGPMDVLSQHGKKYALVLVDDATRYTWVLYLRKKSHAAQEIKDWFALVERQVGRRVRALRSDRGGEFLDNQFRSWLKSKGVMHQLTCSYTPQQNGVVERTNQVIGEKVRCCLSESGLPKKYWQHAMAYVVWIKNRVVNSLKRNMTPIEQLTGDKPSLAMARVFGCIAQVGIPPETRTGKLDPRTRWAIFLGISEESKAWKF